MDGLGWRLAALAVGMTIAAAIAALYPDEVPPVSVACGATALALTAAGSWASFVALGLGRVAVWSYRYAVQNAATAIAAVGGYAVLGVDGALIGLAVGAAVGLAWAARGLGQVLRAPRVPAPAGARRFAALLAVSGVAAQVAFRLPVPLVALGAGTVAAGNAAIGLGIALAAIFTVSHPFAVAMPAALARGEDVTRAEASLLRLGIRTLAVAGAAVLVGAAAGPPLLPLTARRGVPARGRRARPGACRGPAGSGHRRARTDRGPAAATADALGGQPLRHDCRPCAVRRAGPLAWRRCCRDRAARVVADGCGRQPAAAARDRRRPLHRCRARRVRRRRGRRADRALIAWASI